MRGSHSWIASPFESDVARARGDDVWGLRDTVQNVLHAVYRRTLAGAAGAGRGEIDGREGAEQRVVVGRQGTDEQRIGHRASGRAARIPVDVAAGGER